MRTSTKLWIPSSRVFRPSEPGRENRPWLPVGSFSIWGVVREEKAIPMRQGGLATCYRGHGAGAPLGEPLS